MDVLLSYMSVHHMCTWCLWRLEEGIGSSVWVLGIELDPGKAAGLSYLFSSYFLKKIFDVSSHS